jgi:hypothetical protein
MSLADARERCADANRLIGDGIDPVELKRLSDGRATS